MCRLTIDGSCSTISSEDRDLIFFSKNVCLPKGARCCAKHVNNHRLTLAAIDSIKPSSTHYKKLDSAYVQLLISKCKLFFQMHKRLDFDNTLSLSDDDCKIFTSLSKDELDDPVSQVSRIDIRDSTNRSIRTAIGILLCKLRLGLSNRVLASLLQLPDELAISRAIKNATGAVMSMFVPQNLGFNHISRRDIIEQHTSSITRDLMYDGKSDKATIVVDGTYVYIQVNNHGFPLALIISDVSLLEVSKSQFSKKVL